MPLLLPSFCAMNILQLRLSLYNSMEKARYHLELLYNVHANFIKKMDVAGNLLWCLLMPEHGQAFCFLIKKMYHLLYTLIVEQNSVQTKYQLSSDFQDKNSEEQQIFKYSPFLLEKKKQNKWIEFITDIKYHIHFNVLMLFSLCSHLILLFCIFCFVLFALNTVHTVPVLHVDLLFDIIHFIIINHFAHTASENFHTTWYF